MARIQTRGKRAVRPRRITHSSFALEILEERTLLSIAASNVGGMWPLANPTPSNSIIVAFKSTETPTQKQSRLNDVNGYVT